MIDIHCHLLPQIDDGARSIEQALDMARAAVKNGIEYSILTPHITPGRYDNTKSIIRARALQFRAALEHESIPLKVGMAAEVRLAPEILELLDQDEIPFYGELDGFRIMLLEFPHTHIPPGSEKLVEKLLVQGIRPIIAHPERNKDVVRDFNKILPFVEMGCFLQLTASAVAGKFGDGPHKRALQILELDTFKVLATDAHNLKARVPVLTEGRDAAAEVLGQTIADELVNDNPWKLVSRQFLDSDTFWSHASFDRATGGTHSARAQDRIRRTSKVGRATLVHADFGNRTGSPGIDPSHAVDSSRLGGMTAVFRISVGGKRLFRKKARLDKGRIVIGRHPANEITIHGDFVSRHHAVVTLAGDQLQISDLNSKNGLFVNGEKVDVAFLKSGDRLSLGLCDIEFSIEPGRHSVDEMIK